MADSKAGGFIKPDRNKISLFVLLILLFMVTISFQDIYFWWDQVLLFLFSPILLILIVSSKVIDSVLILGLIAALCLYLFSCLIMHIFTHRGNKIFKVLLGVVVLLLLAFLWQRGYI